MNKFTMMVKNMMIAMSMTGIAYADQFHFPHSALLNNWTGFYAGLDAGLALNNIKLNSQQLGFTNPSMTCNITTNSSSYIYGIQLGYLYEFPNNLVAGIDANTTFNTHQRDSLSCTCVNNADVSDRFLFKNQMQSSIKARIGRATTLYDNHLLPYLTVGATVVHAGLSYQNEGGDYYSKNTTQTDWLIGVGLEWALTQSWSLRAEYSYVNYANIKLNIPSIYGLDDPNGNAHINLNSSNILVSINYWI